MATESEGIEKGAILLLSLGKDEAAEVLKNLGPKEVQKLGHAMAALKQVARERVESVIDEFNELVGLETLFRRLGFDVLSLGREATVQEAILGFPPDLINALGSLFCLSALAK